MKYFYLLLLVLFMGQCRYKEENPVIQFPGKPEVPSSIKKEHDYLLDQIHTITSFQDSAGLAAIKLNDLMQHHFKEEEDFVLPALGLLTSLAGGKIPEQSNEIIRLTDKLASQLTHLSVEHQLIKAYMDELKHADTNMSHPEIIEFEKQLHKHANIEEEVFFPAAILIGEYLKLKVTKKP
ncbi:MAG TPA: hemerythrin domain-containing protein [Chitinophagaceae bacterium]|nr:hemerythrin domain-containing protein [Chitinophagaceae bacterium]